jgi:glutaredoxin
MPVSFSKTTESSMKFVIRLFFKTLRVVLGPFMLLSEFITRPKGVVRPPERQREVDAACRDLALYQFRTCPFCIKVRQELRRLSLPVELRDAQAEGPHRDALAQGGGKLMVPCLKITDAEGKAAWLYESGRIIDYLRGRFGTA